MSNAFEDDRNTGKEKLHRASPEATRDEGSIGDESGEKKKALPPSRLFAIFAKLDKPTADEQRFLDENPRTRELGEQIKSAFDHLHNGRVNKRDDPSPSR